MMMPKYKTSLKPIRYQSKRSLDAYDDQSEISKTMYELYAIMNSRTTPKSNQRHSNFVKDEPKHIIGENNKESEEIINVSKDGLNQAMGTVDELYKKFELEYEGLNKVINDLRTASVKLSSVDLMF